MREEWRSILGFEGHYEVSNRGRVRRVSDGKGATPGRVKRLVVHRNGYLTVQLQVSGSRRRAYVHRLVAEAFLPNENQERKEVNHKDADKTNNVIENLEWVSRQENCIHAYRLGLNLPPSLRGKDD